MRLAPFLVAVVAVTAGCFVDPPPDVTVEPLDGATLAALPSGTGVAVSAQRGAFNADGSRLLLTDFERWEVVDVETGGVVAALPAAALDGEPRWSPLHDASVYYFDGAHVQRFDVETRTNASVGFFEDYTRVAGGKDTDLTLTDSGHIKFAAVGDRDDGSRDVVVFSIRERATFGRETVSARAWPVPEGTTVMRAFFTPAGYVVLDGGNSVSVHQELTGERFHTVTNAGRLLDHCRDADGNDVLVFVTDGAWSIVDVATGANGATVRAAAPAKDGSCRATHAPGQLVGVIEDGRADVAVVVDLATQQVARALAQVPGGATVAVPDRNLDRVYFKGGGGAPLVVTP